MKPSSPPPPPWSVRSSVLDATNALRILAATRLVHPVLCAASGLCHRTCLKPSSAPSPPALRPRDRGSQCQRLFPASQSHETRQQSCHASCGGIPRATLIGNDSGGCTRPNTPRCSRNLLEAKFRANAPNGVAVATSIYLCPGASCPPDCTLSAGRAFHAAPAPRQALAQAGCRVIPMQDRDSTVSRFVRDFFESLTASPQTHSPASRGTETGPSGRTSSCGRRPHQRRLRRLLLHARSLFILVAQPQLLMLTPWGELCGGMSRRGSSLAISA